MADLSAVLRKTIDALPSATPQLRAKVYDKARAAVRRQIEAANPPLAPELADARLRSLEEAIESTEAHYSAASDAAAAPAPAAPPTPAPAAPVASPPAAPVQHARPAPPPPEPVRTPVAEDRLPAETASPRVEAERPAPPPFLRTPPPPVRDEPRFEPAPAPRVEPAQVPRVEPAAEPRRPDWMKAPPPLVQPEVQSEPSEPRVGEIGPMAETEAVDSAPAPSGLDAIPQADMTVPGYARPRQARRKSAGGLVATLAILGALGVAGYAGYLYRDDLSGLFGGGQVAEAPSDSTETAQTDPAAPVDGAATAPSGEAPVDPTARQFTQRLLPDGTEVDEGPAETAANAFDEGTDVAAASRIDPEPAVPPVPVQTQAPAAASDPAAVQGGQRAVFYEERSADRPGTQLGGNVVWSVVNEPPAAGQPAEPAIRAVAEIAENDLRMTMTIRRNADATLPASHVIELLFDTPNDFAGGEIENVQRLALKPTEQDRGQPLIGVAGKISDGFFIIALNDLDQAVENNLALLSDEEWIDIPMAYSTGQRALISLEKGTPGDEVFREALDAWAQQG